MAGTVEVVVSPREGTCKLRTHNIPEVIRTIDIVFVIESSNQW